MAAKQLFRNLAAFRAELARLPGPDAAARDAARARDAVLTKPPGALGRLEEIAVFMAGWPGGGGTRRRGQALVFAGNHGVAARGVSAFPAEVTAQMVANFRAGGAAINALARVAGLRLKVTALNRLRPTADFTLGPAMSEAETCRALSAGWAAVDPAASLVVPGEMGIGNTTAAAALSLALFGGRPQDWAGRGTGVDDEGLSRKIKVLRDGLKVNRAALGDPLAVLAALGGFEIAALAGAIAGARAARVPVLLDGFIAGSAAAVLQAAAPGALDHCLAGHVSAEAAHRRLLGNLGLDPLLDLGLRLGEGSGAALAAGIVQAALACHHGMATFAEAAVSARN